MAVFRLPNVLALSAEYPRAVLFEPVVLFMRAASPMAVFELPELLNLSA